MKKLYIILLAAVIALVSCEKQSEAPVELGVKADSATLTSKGGSYMIDVLSNGNWTASTDSEWLSFPEGVSGTGDLALVVAFEENDGADRIGKVTISCGGKSRIVTLIQKGLLFTGIEFLSGNFLAAAEGGTHSASLRCSEAEIVFSVDCGNAPMPWVNEIRMSSDAVEFNVSRNDGETVRTAELTVASSSDPSMKAILHISQPGISQTLKPVDFTQLKSMLAKAGSVTFEENLVLEGRVISDNSENNGGENLNISSTLKDDTRSSRVIYVQNELANSGLLVEFVTAKDNTTARFDRLRLLLKGMKLTRKGGETGEPVRYELSGATVSNVLETVSGTADDLPRKERRIKFLTDDDVYTYVTLSDCEIPIRKGPFVPVDLRYTSVMNKYPMPLRDIHGDATWLLSNVGCAWARDGKGLPEGSGTVSGVIVHEKCDNFEWDNSVAAARLAEGVSLDYITGTGTLSRYQIRPITRSEIAIADKFEDGFSEMLAEFRYMNKVHAALVKNVDSKYTIYSTYPAVADPLTDPSIKGTMLRRNNGKQEMMADWRDWTHLGPLSGNAIANPSGGNGVYDFNGGSLHWNVNSVTRSSGMIIQGNGSAWYCSKWTTKQWWLVTVNTEGLTPANFPLSVNFGAENGLGETVGAPRHWAVEWSLDNKTWKKAADYTVPDFTVVYKKRSWQCPGFKYISVNLPEDSAMLGREKLYIRLRPTSSSSGSMDAYDSQAFVSSRESALNYLSVRYNK